MKRWFAFLLAALLLISAGCVHYEKDQNVEANEEPAAATEPAAQNTPVGQNTLEPAKSREPDLVFDTVTLFGEPVSSSIVKEYDLTVVNFWADWCGWCVYEMPELERIHREYPNVLLLGVLTAQTSMDASLQILKDNGITFITLEPAGTLVETAQKLEAFPTTLFFDKEGMAIGEPVIGAQDYDGWKATVEGLLSAQKEGQAEAETVTEPEKTQGEADLSFDTVTVFGDPISTENLHEYDLVIVNCWAEWCGPCVGEMPELERIHQEYPNVLLIGMLSFSDNVDGAKATISDTGVTYPVILPAGTLMKLLERFDAIPSTVFYDNTGKEIAEPVIGSRSYEEWKAIIEDLLP
jgi:thiol-disulfide isomerase/thioredoxin